MEVGGVSVALRDSSRQAIAALNVALPISHLTHDWIEQAIPRMQKAAQDIEREFKGQGEQALFEAPVSRGPRPSPSRAPRAAARRR